MISGLLKFFRTSAPASARLAPGGGADALYKRLRWQVFLAATLGYSLYYVCRTTLNVVKKPMIDSGLVDASQLGVVSAALLFAYAIGKCANGFLADHANIKRLMAASLAVSVGANALMGALGFAAGVAPGATLAVVFAILWGINGWGQSAGSPCSVVGLSRWFPLKLRGTYYGFFSLSHNLGEFLSFLLVGLLVGAAGWMWGFWGAALAGAAGVALILAMMHDTPESRGLPRVEVLAGEEAAEAAGAEGKAEAGATQTVRPAESTISLQRLALRTPGVWILAGASAFMYMSRYAVNSWGVLFLQETKAPLLVALEPAVRAVFQFFGRFFGKGGGEGDFLLVVATSIISINALLGILGTVLSGWFSDKFFKSDRRMPALIFGAGLTISLVMFLYGGNGVLVNIASMVLFGICIGVLICFLGGLMAVDLVPRKATGAAMGIVGIASYVAAGIQDIISGRMLQASTTLVEGARVHDFSQAAVFWVGASVLSFLLPLLIRKKASG